MMKLYMGVLAISLFCGCATGSYWMPNDKSNRFVGRDAEWVLANFGIPALDYIIDITDREAGRLCLKYRIEKSRIRILVYRWEDADEERGYMRFTLSEDSDVGWRVITDWGNCPLQEWNTQSIYSREDDDPDTWGCLYTGHDEAWVIAKFGKPDRSTVRTASWSDRTVYLIEEFEEHDERTRFKELWYRKHERDPEFILYLKENENGKWIVVADILVPHGIREKREEEQKW